MAKQSATFGSHYRPSVCHALLLLAPHEFHGTLAYNNHD